jgi:hypothetical protein
LGLIVASPPVVVGNITGEDENLNDESMRGEVDDIDIGRCGEGMSILRF